MSSEWSEFYSGDFQREKWPHKDANSLALKYADVNLASCQLPVFINIVV